MQYAEDSEQEKRHPRCRPLWVAFLLLGIATAFLGAARPERANAATAKKALAQSAAQPSAYTLPPAELARSRSLYHWETSIAFGGSLWGILIFLAILQCHWASGLRGWAARWTRRPWLQGLCFFPLLLLLASLLNLPVSIIAHHVSLAYGLSIEGWGTWLADWGKSLLLSVAAGTVALLVLFALIRHTRRWWLWFWILSLPTELTIAFLLPVVVDPLFNHFEPLGSQHPALVAQLERVVEKTGTPIPPSRMYLMRASRKVTGSNAYVTGFGASTRVVVWDTTIESCPTDEILVIFGHELGHYVLKHIQRGLVIGSVLSFFFLWAGFRLTLLLTERYGARWRIASIEDWSSAAILLLVLTVLAFAAEPLESSISRIQEHQADVFGQEVVHGIVAGPQRAAASSFQRLGEQSLDYPDPGPFVVFWTYSHPPIAEREAFAAHYDPWQAGKQPRYFTRQGVLRPQRFWSGL